MSWFCRRHLSKRTGEGSFQPVLPSLLWAPYMDGSIPPKKRLLFLLVQKFPKVASNSHRLALGYSWLRPELPKVMAARRKMKTNMK